MKKNNFKILNTFWILLLIFNSCFSQKVVNSDGYPHGNWVGQTDVLGNKRFIQTRFENTGNGLSSSMDVPSANARRLPISNIKNDGSLQFDVTTPRGIFSFSGQMENGVIKGSISGPGKKGKRRRPD